MVELQAVRVGTLVHQPSGQYRGEADNPFLK
jgi:hypothetical protein